MLMRIELMVTCVAGAGAPRHGSRLLHRKRCRRTGASVAPRVMMALESWELYVTVFANLST